MPKRCPACARAFSDAEAFCSVDGSVLAALHDADPMIGQVLDGRYRVSGRLGEGGMSTVFVAEQAALGREVAVKMVRADRLAEPKAAERLLREARAMSALRSPHVVALLDTGRLDSGAVYLVMERLYGETLGALLAREGRVTWADAVPLLVGMARALADAHRAGIVHRDLKPSNVFLAASAGHPRFVKVLDFGIAWHRDHADARLTSTHAVPGTPSYLAPERLHGAEADPRADVFAFGVIAFELLAGTLPWPQAGAEDVPRSEAAAPAPPLAHACPEAAVPPWLAELVARCLAWSPNLRPRDGAALLALLVARAGAPDAVAAAALAVTGDGPSAALASPAGSPARRGRVRTLLAAAAILLAAAAGYAGGRSTHGDADTALGPPGGARGLGLAPLAVELDVAPRFATLPPADTAAAATPGTAPGVAPTATEAGAEPTPVSVLDPGRPDDPRTLVRGARRVTARAPEIAPTPDATGTDGLSSEEKARIDRLLERP